VAADSLSFTFPTPIAYNTPPAFGNQFSAYVSAQPAGQTCGVTDGYGIIDAATNVATVRVTCVNNATSPLQGAYQLSASGSAVTKWAVLAADGTYIFADIQYPPNPAAGCYGVDYGAYNWNSTSNAFAIVNALVYLPLANPPASCGFTNTQGVPDTVPRTLTVSGSGPSSVITIISNGASTFTGTPVPSNTGSLVGAWTFGPSLDQGMLIFGTDGYYLIMSTQADPTTNSGAVTGVEYGCYTTSNVTTAGGTINFDTTADCSGAETGAGSIGFSDGQPATGSVTYATPDANTFQTIFQTYTFSYTRFVPN
jgi:hypothetical protein